MPISHHNALIDIFQLTIIALALAIPLYHFIRNNAPELSWNTEGKVSTAPFDTLDLLGCAVCILFYCLKLYQHPEVLAAQAEKAKSLPEHTRTLTLFINVLFTAAIPIAFITAMLYLRRKLNPFDVFGLRPPKDSSILRVGVLGGLLIWLCHAIFSTIISPALKHFLGEPQAQDVVQQVQNAKDTPALLVILIISAAILAPLVEEFVFRGYIYGTVKRFTCRLFALIITAMLFAVVHATLWGLPSLFIVGLGLAILYERTGSLWTNIIAHATFNSITLALIIIIDTEKLPL